MQRTNGNAFPAMTRRRFVQATAGGAITAGLAIRAGATGAAATQSTSGKIVLATGFMPNVQFAPYYLAEERGYFKDAGLDVSIQDGASPDLMQQLGNGKIHFLVTGGDSLTLARSNGIPVIYAMAQFQRYPVGAISISGKGPALTGPADLKGKKIGVSQLNGSTYIGLLALLHAAGLTLKDVEVITIGFTEVEALQQGRVEVAMTYITNEPAQVKAMGVAVNVLPVADHVNLISTGLAVGSDRVDGNPDQVQAIVTASLQGLRDTLAEPDAAFAATLRRMPEVKGDAAQEKLQRAVLDATIAFEQAPKGHPFGWSDPEAWQTTVDLLHEIEMLKSSVDPSTLYTNRFADTANIA